MDEHALREEAYRQGEAYSRLLTEDPESFVIDPYWDFERRARVIWMKSLTDRFLQDPQPLNLLETGCGTGWTTFETARRFSARIGVLTALDTSEKALARACEQLPRLPPEQQSRIVFHRENFFDHQGGPYHMVYMHSVFEHIPNPDAIFQKVNSLLVQGGLFALTTPNWNRPFNRLMDWLRRPRSLVDPLHIKEYTVEDLSAPKPGFTLCELTGRQLMDSDTLRILMSFGLKPLYRALGHLPARIVNRPSVHAMGKLAPAWSNDLWAAYKKIGT